MKENISIYNSITQKRGKKVKYRNKMKSEN